MSHWIEINNPDQVEIVDDELQILYDSDDWGNNYIALPMDIIRRLIESDNPRSG